MHTEITRWNTVKKYEGIFLVPHELLHVAAHRLIGRKCSYKWGENRVYPLEPCSWREDVFCLLFPLIVTLPIGVIPFLLWGVTFVKADYPPVAYISVAPFWHILLLIVGIFLLTYAIATSVLDIRMVATILLKHLSQNPPKYPDKKHNKRH